MHFTDEKKTSRPLQYILLKKAGFWEWYGEEGPAGWWVVNYSDLTPIVSAIYYESSLTELHLDDWTIASAGRKQLGGVQGYRRWAASLLQASRKSEAMLTDVALIIWADWGEEYQTNTTKCLEERKSRESKRGKSDHLQRQASRPSSSCWWIRETGHCLPKLIEKMTMDPEDSSTRIQLYEIIDRSKIPKD